MSGIENYNLFGESDDLPDVVHCETIEARSVLHDWEFKPHRHARLHQVLMIERGAGRAEMDGTTAALGGHALANVPAGVVHSSRFEPGTEGWVVTVARDELDRGLIEGEGLRSLLESPAIIRGDGEIASIMRAIFASFETRDFARAHVLRALVMLLFGLVARRIAAEGAPQGPASPLQRRFEALLEAQFASHLPVSAYAARLGVTPTHLSRVMRRATGRSASAAITARVIREAQRNLAYSNLSISEVAYALGYNDPAHFSRVFSRATGLSPRAFRKKTETSPTG